MLQPSTYFWHETLPSASNSMRKWLDLFHKNVQLPTKNALAMHSGSFAEFWTEFWLGVFDSLDKDLQWSLSAVKMFKMSQNKSNKSQLILGSSILICLRNICIFVFNGINSLRLKAVSTKACTDTVSRLYLNINCYVMLCYVMLCYVMLCYVMLCYVMLCYVMLCYVMLCYVMLCYVMLCYVMLCYVMLCYVMLCYVMLWYMYYLLSFSIASWYF